SETPMPIQVGPLEAIPRNSFVRIRGVPAAAVLSEGHSIAPGSWAVPLSVLPNLRISIPVGVSGKTDITIALVQIDGTVLAEARASLVVAAAEMIAPAQPAAPRERSVASVGNPPAPLEASPPPAPRPPMPAASAPVAKEPAPLTEEQKRALGFIVRGRAQAQQGNIAAARLFYQRAAEADLAEGALALAGTYDPAELAAMGVAGVQPDIALARRWYEKARDLGAREAEERLKRLSAR
ncbi:MAG: sel1 repeat family protein, partial [Hyphomicrobium sp.]|nr:sel1 repeat family protein [Hyphomicrobium sp.]